MTESGLGPKSSDSCLISHASKVMDLEEMDRFLEKFYLLRLSQEEIEIMNNPITSTETEVVI